MAKEPESWGEMVAGYRDTYGGRSYQSIKRDGSNMVRRLSTSGPFLTDLDGINNYSRSEKHSSLKRDTSIDNAINQRHGRGTLNLLHSGKSAREQASNAKPSGRKLIPGAGPGVAANRPGPAHLTDRKDLFGVLQGSEAGATDGWIGNELIDPTKGKTCSKAKQGGANGKSWIKLDKSSRVEDDGWIGNIQICPQKGKKPTPGPEKKTNRKDLFEVMNGAGNSKSQDSWIGNIAIDPTKGKGASTSSRKEQNLHGVMQHKFLKGDGSARREAVKKENIGGFNFSDFSKPESSDKKFGKRIYLDENKSKKIETRKTGTAKIAGSR